MNTQPSGNTFFALLFSVTAGVASMVNADNYSETYVTSTRAYRDPQTLAVSYADLNLAGSVGRQILLQRVLRAAEKVCGSVQVREAGSMYRVRKNKACQERAVSDALSQLQERQLASAAR